MFAPPVLGMIYYEARTPEDFAKARATNVAEEEAADIEDSEGIATTDSVMGAP